MTGMLVQGSDRNGEALSDLAVINLLAERRDAKEPAVLRNPAVDVILRRLGLVTGSLSILREGTSGQMRFDINDQAMMLGFEIDEGTRAVRDEIQKFTSRGGYQLKGSHYAGFQYHEVLADIYAHYSAVLDALIHGPSVLPQPADYVAWQAHAVKEFRGGLIAASDGKPQNDPNLARIDLLAPGAYWAWWRNTVDQTGRPPFLEESVRIARERSGSTRMRFDRAERFGFVDFASTEAGISPWDVMLALAFVATSAECQQLLCPPGWNLVGGWAAALRFLFRRWQVVQKPDRYRIVTEAELLYKHVLTLVATRLLDPREDDKVESVAPTLAEDEFLALFEPADFAAAANLPWRRLVALDAWNLVVAGQVAGVPFDDDDIEVIAGLLTEVTTSIRNSGNFSRLHLTETALGLLRGRTRAHLERLSRYANLLPVTLKYRSGLPVKNQVIVPIAQQRKLAGVFIAGTDLGEAEIRWRFGPWGVDVITKALALPYTWQQIEEFESADKRKAELVKREDGWQHKVRTHFKDFDKLVNDLAGEIPPAVRKELQRWLVRARRAFDTYDGLAARGNIDQIDLEALIDQVADETRRRFPEESEAGDLVVQVEREGERYAVVRTYRVPLREALLELAYNGAMYATKPATVILSCEPRASDGSVTLRITNTGISFPDVRPTRRPEEAEVLTKEDWVPKSATGRGLEFVWQWIKDDLSPNLNRRLLRYFDFDERTTTVEVVLDASAEVAEGAIRFARDKEQSGKT